MTWDWETMGKGIVALLVAAIIIWFVLAPSGAFSKLKEATSGVKSFANIDIGAREEAGGFPSLLPQQQVSVDSFVEAVKAMQEKAPQRKPGGELGCFQQYTPFPPLADSSLILKYSPSPLDLTTLIVKGGKDGLQEVEYHEFPGLRPCVIAGSKSFDGKATSETAPIAENFRTTFLSRTGRIVKPYFLETGTITLQGDGDKNKLTAQGESLSEIFTFNDGGWLFTPDGKRICFLPGGGSGLNQKEVTGTGSMIFGTIPYGLQQGYTLHLCTIESERFTYLSAEFWADPSYVSTGAASTARVQQLCAGEIGTDCPATSFQGSSCDAEFSAYFSGEHSSFGCSVVATTPKHAASLTDEDSSERSYVQCGWGVVEEGQILSPDSDGDQQGTVLRLLPGAVSSYESVWEQGWQSPSSMALLCAQRKWQGCTMVNQGDIQKVDENMGEEQVQYVCTQQGGIPQWQRS